jgi:hypothetical protein
VRGEDHRGSHAMCVSLSCRGRGQGKKGEDEGVRWARAKERKEVEIGPADGLVCSVEKRKKEGKMGRRGHYKRHH